jgi:mRNA interferase RelE/StbE
MEIKYSRQAEKFLENSQNTIAVRIMKKVEELRSNPSPRDSKMVHGYREKLFRVRVGDYRVDYKNKIIGIVKIDDRPRVYDK